MTSLKISDRIAWRKIDGSVYIVTISNSYLHSLNRTATLIWELLNKEKSKAEIIKNVCEEFEIEPFIAERDVEDFLNQMKEKGIIL